jgi:lipid A 3-O-deacylase PagL
MSLPPHPLNPNLPSRPPNAAPDEAQLNNEDRPQRKTPCHPEGIRSGCPKDLNVQSSSQPIRQAPASRRPLQPLALAAILLATLAITPVARAQGDTEFGVWGGYSLGNPHLIGISGDHQFGVVGLRYGHSIYDWSAVSLEYTLDLLPAEIIRQPTYVQCATNPTKFPQGLCQTGHEVVYSGGLNPLGLKLNFRREHQLQLFGASTAGFIASTRPVPIDVSGGTQFNFTFDFQAGFQLYNSARSRAWILGYKYQHISNAYRHSFNPGVDFNSIFLGYSFFR